MRVAVVLFNLGGPDSLDAVEPFLRNLFSDPAVIALPALLRRPLARIAARRRAPIARAIYAKLGGASPINEETRMQATALDAALAGHGVEARSFVAMRCWHPFIAEAIAEVRAWSPERIVLLPLYPQYSTATTASSFAEWERATHAAGLKAPADNICCYPTEHGFIAAMAGLIQDVLTRRKSGVNYRVLLSAHGLPERTIRKGDPYRWQVEETAKALVDRLGADLSDWVVCFQSRVGPLKWIGPSTDGEIIRAGEQRKGLIVVPIAFVSEHSETLVELDIEYAKLAREHGVRDYLRVATVGTHPAFIAGLAHLVMAAVAGTPPVRSCLGDLERCYRRG